MTTTIDQEEKTHFTKFSHDWWHNEGEFKILHQINPLRISYLQQQVTSHFGKNEQKPDYSKLKLLDVGCGGGILAEPLSRLGFAVTAIDMVPEAIEAAKTHAEALSKPPTYLATSIEELAATKPKTKFDIVVMFEILEHVADVKLMLETAKHILNPGGMLIISTMNRTAKSLALGKFAAEYLLRWLSPGSHDWHKFIKPSELVLMAEAVGFTNQNLCGMTYQLCQREFTLNERDLAINYFASFTLTI